MSVGVFVGVGVGVSVGVGSTMALRRKNASFSASSATKRGLTNIARPSSTKTARPFVAVVERWRGGWDRGWWGI